jgi:hypothetical protein
MKLNTSIRGLTGIFAMAALIVIVAAGVALASATGVITGTLSKIDTGAKTVAVKTADGTVKTVKVTGKTTVTGAKDVAKAADLVGKEGGHVIVHTVGEGAEETAHAIIWVGDKTVKASEVTVDDVGKATKTVAVKTADGTKDTFVVADHATVDTGKDVGKYSVVGVKKGEHVTVYYTEDAGKKIAHAFEHL